VPAFILVGMYLGYILLVSRLRISRGRFVRGFR
jgi:hypothetical protein